MAYQLIALDIDGTLLNSRKEVPADAAAAIRAACAAGKTVVFDTGRAVSELTELFTLLPEVRFAVCASGGGLYDAREHRTFGLCPIPDAQIRRILSVSRTKDVMPQLVLPVEDVIQESHMENLEHYRMGIYRPLYKKAMTLVPDIYAFAESCPEPIVKLNLYHTNPEERILTRGQLETPELEMVYSEVTSLESSAAGVNKGSGLERLCGLLGIPISECIAVGDADNDLPMLKAAGLGVAMGNAAEHIKAAADRVVSDCDHGGCAEAVRMLLDE